MAFQTILPDTSPHYTETVFRRYENDLKALCTHYPKEITFKLKPTITPTTWISALRCAARAFLHPTCRWISTIDKQMLMTIFVANIRFKSNVLTHEVTACPSTHIAKDANYTEAISVKHTVSLSRDEPTFRAICHLKNLDILKDAIRVVGLSPEFYSISLEYPNIELVPSDGDDPTCYSIL